MVILLFSEQKGAPKEVEFDPETTSDNDMKKILMTKYGFKDGNYLFLYSGKALKGQTPFKNIKERSRIIVFIKPLKTQSEKPSTNSTAAQPAPAQTPQTAPIPQRQPPTPRPQPQPRPSPQQQQNPQLTQQQVLQNKIADLIKLLNIDRLYDPENRIWEHTAKLAEIAEIVNQNPSLLQTLRYYMTRDQIPGVAATYLHNAILLLLDIQVADFMPCESEANAKYETLSMENKAIFDALVSQFNDREKVMQVLEETSFNKDEAIKKLSSN